MTDYISREALKSKIRAAFPSLEDRCRINEIVNSLPAADVKPVVHGHWEESPMNGIVCSECGRERPLEPFGETEWSSDFCPWCGADMRKEANK